MKKSIKVFIATFGLLSMTVTTFADNPNLVINVGKGYGSHASTNGLANNVIKTSGIVTPQPTRPAPIIGVESSFTHPYIVFATKSEYKHATITASISNPKHGHRLYDTGNDEY